MNESYCFSLASASTDVHDAYQLILLALISSGANGGIYLYSVEYELAIKCAHYLLIPETACINIKETTMSGARQFPKD